MIAEGQWLLAVLFGLAALARPNHGGGIKAGQDINFGNGKEDLDQEQYYSFHESIHYCAESRHRPNRQGRLEPHKHIRTWLLNRKVVDLLRSLGHLPPAVQVRHIVVEGFTGNVLDIGYSSTKLT